MYCQLRLIQNKDLGVDIKNMLQIESGEASTHYELFKKNLNPVITELKKSPFIEHAFRQPEELISHKNFRPSDYIEWEGKNEIDQFSLDLLMIDDYSFFDAFRIKKKEGRLFSENHGNETDKVVINEKLAARINNPLGKNIKLNDRQYEIIGIVNDFQLYSPTEEPPATMVMLSSWLSYIYVRLQNDKTTEALEYINSILQKHGISNYKMRFLTDKYSDFTKADRLVMQIISSVAVVCLIVSIFATYSLTLFTMERRRREVAIRKVMGASVTNIIRLFLKEYMWLAAVACIVSIPPAYYIMHKWLQSYIYRINITWWLVAAVIIIVVAVIIATVLRQIIKAANSNPAEVIKYD